ncbi:MAG: hypothetical protein NVSMB37_0270 [Candidatus Saccharimonadales bacterium]
MCTPVVKKTYHKSRDIHITALEQWLDTHIPAKLRRLLHTKIFAHIYQVFAIVVLLGSTIYWSILGGLLQNGNADQLINSYLFENAKTFQQAQFPSQHSFLIKWPIFWLIHLFGSSEHVYIIATVMLCLLTVGSFAYILGRIERRPLMLGSLFLALASVLALIPVQPYPGGLLPVNMAMVATRNIEYIILLAGVVLVMGAKKHLSIKLFFGTFLLTLLIASDRLYATLIIGGALLAVLAYVVRGNWHYARHAGRLLIVGLVAFVLSWGVIWLVNTVNVTHIVQRGVVGPYGVSHTPKKLAEGFIYGILGVSTNFGANPAQEVTIFRQMPREAVHQLLSPSAFPLLLNAGILLTGLFLGLKLLWQRHCSVKLATPVASAAQNLSLLLLWMSVASFIVFVGSNHYFAGDARYLGLILFALFVTAASYLRTRKYRPEIIVGIGLLMIASTVVGLASSRINYEIDQQALSIVNDRNDDIVNALEQHPTDVLVGDFWRVAPIRLASNNTIHILPLATCTTPRDVLTSKNWQPDLNHASFAYVLSLDQKLTDYPICSLTQIVDTYGRPNSTTIIAGSHDNPREVLLFYDKGINHAQQQAAGTPSKILSLIPTELANVPKASCAGNTTMNIVAHQDDDLLFMNPDIFHDIKAGRCVRTIYLTAGDAGHNKFYWLKRQQGSEAAYSNMLDFHDIWVERSVKLANNQYVTIANPRGMKNVSLVFMQLPDGNINGAGFRAYSRESLAKLDGGRIQSIHSVADKSSYNSAELTEVLSLLMQTYTPSAIRAQANFYSRQYPDHSDHMAVGRFTKRALELYAKQLSDITLIPSISFYNGYPIREFPANVKDTDLAAKQAAFLVYGKYDNGVCHTTAECAATPTYNAYLQRQYVSPRD